MTESHSPSYYEIALTNRQVLVAFVVLLICVLGAFLSGVWVGRRAAPMVASVAEEETAQADVEEEPAFEEFSFFSDQGGARSTSPSLPEVAETPRADTTLLEDIGGEDRAEKARTQAQASPADETVAAVRSARVRTEPSETPPVPAVDGLVVQVFSSPDETQARKVLERLRAGGFTAFLIAEEVSGQTMHRVRIGPFAEASDAREVADRIRQAYRLDTWITR